MTTATDVAARLPDIETLRQRCRAVAMLDAILSPDAWDSRWFSYTHDWGDGASCAQMHDGSGNDCYLVFTAAGAFIRGFDHESPMTPWRIDPPQLWPGLVDDVPNVFRGFLAESAFGYDGVFAATYVMWRQRGDSGWRSGLVNFGELDESDDPQGAQEFLELLTDGTPQSYIDFARWYFEVSLDPTAVAHVWNLQPLTEEVVRTLNPRVRLPVLAGEIAESNYPR